MQYEQPIGPMEVFNSLPQVIQYILGVGGLLVALYICFVLGWQEFHKGMKPVDHKDFEYDPYQTGNRGISTPSKTVNRGFSIVVGGVLLTLGFLLTEMSFRVAFEWFTGTVVR